jgi:hypothetical protein
MNSLRGTLGRFLVKCQSCGRKGIYENKQNVYNDRVKPNSCDVHNPYGQSNYSFINTSCNWNNKNGKTESTMSFFNKEYNDIEQTYCYNCLNKQNQLKLISNYNVFPAVNGPPIVNAPPTIATKSIQSY